MPDPNAGDMVCASLRSRNTDGHFTMQSHFVWKIRGNMPGTQILRDPFCASLRSRNAYGHFTRAILYEHLQEKCRTPIPRQACAVETHMDMSREPFCAEIYKKNAGHEFRARHFARACASKTHMDISEEPFCVEISRKNAGPEADHLD